MPSRAKTGFYEDTGKKENRTNYPRLKLARGSDRTKIRLYLTTPEPSYKYAAILHGYIRLGGCARVTLPQRRQ